MWQLLRRLVRKSVYLKILFNIFRYVMGRASIVSVAPLYFDGWQMATGTRSPWIDGGTNALSKNFTEVDLLLKGLVAEKK